MTACSAENVDQGRARNSIVGSRFVCAIVGETTADSFDAIIPAVTGMAYQYGSSQFTVDPGIPSCPGSSCGNKA